MVVFAPEMHSGRKNLRTIGQCIYCGAGSKETRLTDEHIIPYSLGSDRYLKDASCVECAKITRDLEMHVAHNIFGHHRIHSGIQTRNPKKRPTELPLIIVRESAEERIELPIEDHPYFLSLPVWDRPGIVRNISPSNEFSGLTSHVYSYAPNNIGETLGIPTCGSLNIRPVSVAINPEIFARVLAKISYCQLVARLGLDGFRPLAIVDVILGKYSCVPYFVGSYIDGPLPPPAEKKYLHTVENVDAVISGKRLWLTVIRLFANSGTKENGMPIYTVITGAAKPCGAHPQ